MPALLFADSVRRNLDGGDLVAIAAAILAVVASWLISRQASKQADRALVESAQANILSNTANNISLESNAHSKEANQIAKRSFEFASAPQLTVSLAILGSTISIEPQFACIQAKNVGVLSVTLIQAGYFVHVEEASLEWRVQKNSEFSALQGYSARVEFQGERLGYAFIPNPITPVLSTTQVASPLPMTLASGQMTQQCFDMRELSMLLEQEKQNGATLVSLIYLDEASRIYESLRIPVDELIEVLNVGRAWHDQFFEAS